MTGSVVEAKPSARPVHIQLAIEKDIQAHQDIEIWIWLDKFQNQEIGMQVRRNGRIAEIHYAQADGIQIAGMGASHGLHGSPLPHGRAKPG